MTNRFAPPARCTERVRAFLCGLVAAGLAGTGALADDTEVYKATLSTEQTAALKPNVLFVLDSSGSMLNPITGESQPFKTAKPETFYDGGLGTCRHDRVYWSTNGTAPSCDTTQYFAKSKLRCQTALEQLDQGGAGRFQDRIARYDTTDQRWHPLGTTAALRDPPHVECRADRGRHGETTGSDAVYAIDGAAEPWAAGQGSELEWASAGGFYTLFSGKYMNYVHNGSVADPADPTRLEVMQAAANQIVSINRHHLFAGLMRFDTRFHGFVSGNKGGPVLFPIKDVSEASVNAEFQSSVESLTGLGATPLSETLYEAFLYYNGRTPLFGTDPENDLQSAPSTMSGGQYVSPIDLACQKNYVVLLTDGVPTADSDALSEINAELAGFDTRKLEGQVLEDASCDADDNCLDELAELMAETDNGNLATDTPIQLFTIGFLTDQVLLKEAARKGQGDYFTATNASELNEAFQNILSIIQEEAGTSSAPAVSVNAFNRITNRDELFFALFTPTDRFRWPGNIKRYQLTCAEPHPTLTDFCADGSDPDDLPDPPIIVDADGSAAVDPDTGFFRETARSVWTDSAAGPDGHQTERGGAAQVFGGYSGVGDSGDDPPDPPRKVYTYTGTYSNASGTLTPASEAVLSNPVNVLVETNTRLTDEVDVVPAGGDGIPESLLYPSGRVASEPAIVEVLKHARGIDVLDVDSDGRVTDARHQFGDGLHTNPQVVSYGGTEDNPDLVLFSTNNDGYLHAIDVSDGSEIFSWIPKALLPRLPALYANPGAAAKSYGLDGPMTVWVNDVDGDGQVESADGDHVYLYVGQRRGGRSYWALDVTVRSAPRLLWKLVGGVDGSDFHELGQSWSEPTRATVKIDGAVREVLIFAGGYDPAQDNASAPADDQMGRAIFMVDAATGRRLWHAGHPDVEPSPNLPLSEMTNSIPSDLRVFDITGDGLDDRIVVGDTRGQLWRLDIHNETNTGADDLVTGAVLAELQQTSSLATPGPSDNRRFFYRPDVTLATPEEAQPFLAITIGSGYRPHPLSTEVHERFYMIRDVNIGNVSAYPPAIDESSLFNVTETLQPTREQLFGTPSNPTIGWMLDLADAATDSFVGEKSLSQPLVFDNTVLFTTFVPPTSGFTEDCEPASGDARVYAVDIFDGSPLLDLDTSTTSSDFTRSDRQLELLQGGIPPNVVVLFSKMNGVTPLGFVGAEQLDLAFTDAPVKTYWFQQDVQ